MWWLIGVILLIIAGFRFPKLGLGLLAVVVIGLIVIGAKLAADKRESEAAKTRIAKSEIEFDNLHLLPSYGTGSFKLTGRIRNRSPRYTLSSIQLRLRMDDCAKLLSAAEVTKIEEIRKDSSHHTAEQRAALSELTRRMEEQRSPTYQRPCETVGETLDYVFATVPPGQARNLDEFVSFSSLGQARGEHVWKHEIVEVSGREDHE